MLVLSRKQGEQIVIGSNVTITILKVQGQRVRLGIDARNGIPIHRDEILQQPQSKLTTYVPPSLFCECSV